MADLPGLDAASLLGRAELPLDFRPVRDFLRGKRVLVTGAGGSVGSALAAFLCSVEPASVLLLDQHEHSLYALYRRFSNAAGGPEVDIALADVRNLARMRSLFLEARPQVVFHLAAYKHVPLGEKFPEEVVSVNVFATEALLRLSTELGVEAFAYPSSDKAVNPPSLYGATKRLAETLVQRVGAESGRCFEVARFVNIVGTFGSVIETLGQQIRQDLPLTITDPAMTRYWITMSEAVWLLAAVLACEPRSGVSMLDAQVEIPVVDMAQRLASQLNSRQRPHPVVFTGMRPGERLREELLSANEQFVPGPLPGLLRVRNRCREQNLARVDAQVEQLRGAFESGDRAALRERAMAAAMVLQ